MKKAISGIMAVIFFVSFTSMGVWAADDGGMKQLAALPQAPGMIVPGIAQGVDTRISLDLRNIEIIEALKYLAAKAKWNIIMTKDVAGRVTLNVEDASIQDVFDIMLRSNGLAYAKQGDIFNVMTETEYRNLYGRKFSDARTVKVFRLKYAIPEQAFSMLDTMKSDVGRILVDADSGTVLIMDTPDRIADIDQAIQLLEQKSVIKIFPLKYARAKEITEQLKSQLDSKKAGLVRADLRANQVIVQTLPERMKDIEEMITALDKKTKEVMISTRIIQVTLSDSNTTGVQWEGLFNLFKSNNLNYLGSYPFSAVQSATEAWRSRRQVLSDVGYTGSYPFSGTTASTTGPGPVTSTETMHVGTVSQNVDYDAAIHYLQTLGKTKILSSPSLAVINNEEATIHIGARQAYVTTTTTTSSNTTTVAEEVTYMDIGVQLALKPTINDDGFVTVDIKPEISSIIDYLVTPSNNKIPIVNTSATKTTVMVKDGSTIIIGGLSTQDLTENSDQTPGLSKLPGVGNLFKNKTSAATRTELLIMITPVIIEGDKIVSADMVDEKDHGPKPAKKFDVFREEPQTTRGIPFKEEGSDSDATSAPKDSLRPKGFRTY